MPPTAGSGRIEPAVSDADCRDYRSFLADADLPAFGTR